MSRGEERSLSMDTANLNAGSGVSSGNEEKIFSTPVQNRSHVS
jgi:hypothetical protein